MITANYFGTLLNDSYSYDIPISATIKTIQPISKTPAVTLQPAVNASVLSSTNSTAMISVSSMVIDVYGAPFSSANISVNGVKTAQTNANGYFYLNVRPTDIITVTYIGNMDMQYTASNLPKQILLSTTAEQLAEVVVKPKPKPVTPPETKPTNWLLWIGLGVGAIAVFKKFGSKKVVKATI